MSIWIVFFLGIFIGWLIEWAIDWLFWRRNAAKVYAESAQLRGELEKTQVELAAAEAMRTNCKKMQAQLNATRAELAGAMRERDALQLANAAAAAELTALRSAPVRGSAIDSAIDSDIDSGMNATSPIDGEIETGNRLTALDVRRELESLRLERDALHTELNKVRYAAGAQAFVRRDDLEQISGIGPVYEQRLFNAGIETYGQLAASTPAALVAAVEAKAGQTIDYAAWIRQAEHFATVVNEELLPNRLEEINGIGPVYANRLRAANLKSFAALAACSTEQIEDILGKGRRADYASWIEQAKAYLELTSKDRAPSGLEHVKGIGPIFAARLEMAGVTGFAELSRLSEDELRKIIGPNGWSLVNYERWMAQARQFARQNL